MLNRDIPPPLYYETHTRSNHTEWVLFVHGAGGSTRTWRKQLAAFEAHYNVLVVDLPGHAGSAESTEHQKHYDFSWIANKIWQVVDHLSILKVHIVAVSLGSIISMQMQYNRPNQVVSMVFAGPIIALNTKLRLLARSGLSLAKIVGFQRFYAITAKITLPKKNHKKSREIFVRESKLLSNEEYKKWTAMYGKCLDNTLKLLFLKNPAVPLFFIIGNEDHLFKGPALRYAEAFSNVTHALVERCGHLVSLEKSDVFNALCFRFLAQQSAGE
jgi:pimeloyl-ACP methyl ester carboxylesterase